MASIRKCLNAIISASKSHNRTQLLRQRLNSKFTEVRPYSSQVYDGDGKTHAVLLHDDNQGLMIGGYSQLGFSLNNNVTVLGPMAIFPNCVLSWNVGDIGDINEQALSLFFLLEPKLDILVLGVPEFSKKDRTAANALINMVRKQRIQVEVMQTEQACSTFNFLVAEQRFVGAAIIPPHHVTDTDNTQAMTGAFTVGYANHSQ